MPMTRRDLLLGAAATGAFAALPARAEGPVLTADGLYNEPWFLDSFLDLATIWKTPTRRASVSPSCGS